MSREVLPMTIKGFLQFILEGASTSSHLYIRHPSGKVVHGPYANEKGHANLHVDLSLKHGMGDRGKAYDSMEKGVIHIDHDKKRVRAHANWPTPHVHNDVAAHIHHHYPYTKNYSWEDRT
jgi:hypothetical protein